MNNDFLTKNEILYLKKLKQKKYRQENKQFLIEGKHLIDEGSKIKDFISMIITSDLEYKTQSDVKIKYCSYDTIKTLSTTSTPQEYIGLCNFINANKEITSRVVIALDSINDPGNLGTIIRTSHSFGIQDVIVNGVDIYNPKVVRSSQGSLFHSNVFNANDLLNELSTLKSKGYKIVGALLDDAVDYNDINFDDSEKIVIVLGNEANGISKEIASVLDFRVYIPIKFESLNVAIAGAILIAKYTK